MKKQHKSPLTQTLPEVLTHEEHIVEQHIREGRFQRGLSLITGISGLLTGLEVSYEHYRGSYGQRIMYTPVILSFCLGIAGGWAALSRKAVRAVLPINGSIGFFYHVRGVTRRPGGLKKPMYNVIYGPPVLAPLIFAATGSMGLLTSLLRRAK